MSSNSASCDPNIELQGKADDIVLYGSSNSVMCPKCRAITYNLQRTAGLETETYTAKNQILLKTGCSNIVGETLFPVVNEIVQHCYT